VQVYAGGAGQEAVSKISQQLGQRDRHLRVYVLAPRAVRCDLQHIDDANSVIRLNSGLRPDYAADLRHRAFHDALTGLANRALLREHLAHAIERAARGTPLAVLLIDLDGFKQINDVHGHAAGDHLLVTIAQRLRDAVRGADTAARLGGDEFAVVLDGMDAAEDAHFVATRLLASIQAPVQLPDGPITPRASIGVATWHGHDIDALMHDADLAMYAAKTAGKGKVVRHLAETGVA